MRLTWTWHGWGTALIASWFQPMLPLLFIEVCSGKNVCVILGTKINPDVLFSVILPATFQRFTFFCSLRSVSSMHEDLWCKRDKWTVSRQLERDWAAELPLCPWGGMVGLFTSILEATWPSLSCLLWWWWWWWRDKVKSNKILINHAVTAAVSLWLWVCCYSTVGSSHTVDVSHVLKYLRKISV